MSHATPPWRRDRWGQSGLAGSPPDHITPRPPALSPQRYGAHGREELSLHPPLGDASGSPSVADRHLGFCQLWRWLFARRAPGVPPCGPPRRRGAARARPRHDGCTLRVRAIIGFLTPPPPRWHFGARATRRWPRSATPPASTARQVAPLLIVAALDPCWPPKPNSAYTSHLHASPPVPSLWTAGERRVAAAAELARSGARLLCRRAGHHPRLAHHQR